MHSNLPILFRLERIGKEQHLCMMIRDQLIKFKQFWEELEQHRITFDIEPQLQCIVDHNSIICRMKEQLTAVHPLTSQHSQLFSMYC